MLRTLQSGSQTLWLFRKGNKETNIGEKKKKERKKIPGCLKKLESEFRNMAGD